MTPVNTSNKSFNENHFFSIVFENDKPFGGFLGSGIALISLASVICDPVRIGLRSLDSHFKNIQIYDLGYLKVINQETIHKIISLCISFGVVPVFTGYELSQESIENMNSQDFIVSNHIYHGNTECNYIAYQRHLCKMDDIHIAEEHRYDTISLGKMRSNPNLLEPVLRDIDLLFVDLQALRTSEAPNIQFTYPTGLQAEEICQILKYAGMGCKIRGVFFQAMLRTGLSGQEVDLIAESIWYFAEGINIRLNDHPEKSTDHTQFILHSPSQDVDLEFFKHNQTSKWWLKHPSSQVGTKYLACSYEEYQSSMDEELPERILKFINNS